MKVRIRTASAPRLVGNNIISLDPAGKLEIHSSGRFPMRPSFRNYIYKHPTIAIHQHDYSGSLLIGARRFKIRPGDVTITPPNVVSQYDLSCEGFHWCVHFDQLEGVKKSSFPLHLHTGAAAAYVSERLEQIVHLQRKAGMNRRSSDLFAAAASAAFSALLLWLAVFAREKKLPAQGRIGIAMEKLQKTIEERFRERLTAVELARSAGFSQDYLAEQFRRHFGMTLQRYLLSRRMEMARNLLLSTELPVKAVAWECGIPDQQYFNKQFRRVCGMSPTLFRQGSGR